MVQGLGLGFNRVLLFSLRFIPALKFKGLAYLKLGWGFRVEGVQPGRKSPFVICSDPPAKFTVRVEMALKIHVRDNCLRRTLGFSLLTHVA